MTQATETIFSSLPFELESHSFSVCEKDVIYSLETSMHYFPYFPADLNPVQEAHNLQLDASILSSFFVTCDFFVCHQITFRLHVFQISILIFNTVCTQSQHLLEPSHAYHCLTVHSLRLPLQLNSALSGWAADAVFNCESDWL